MIFSKQEKQRLLEIEQDYENRLSTIDELSNSYEQSQRMLEKREQEVRLLQQRVSFFQGEIAKYNEITEEVEAYVNEREAQISRLNKEVMESELKEKTLQEEKENLSKAVKEKQIACVELEQKLKICDGERLSEIKKFEASKNQINVLSKLLEQSEVIFVEKESDISQLNEKVMRMESELQEKDSTLKSKLLKKNQEIESISILYEEVKAAHQSSLIELSKLSQEYNHMIFEKEGLESNYQELELQRNNTQLENDQLKKAKYDEEINALTDQLKQDKDQVEEQAELIQQLSDKNEELQRGLQTLSTQYLELQRKEASKDQELVGGEQTREALQLLEVQLGEKNIKIDDLETQIIELMIELES